MPTRLRAQHLLLAAAMCLPCPSPRFSSPHRRASRVSKASHASVGARCGQRHVDARVVEARQRRRQRAWPRRLHHVLLPSAPTQTQPSPKPTPHAVPAVSRRHKAPPPRHAPPKQRRRRVRARQRATRPAQSAPAPAPHFPRALTAVSKWGAGASAWQGDRGKGARVPGTRHEAAGGAEAVGVGVHYLRT